MFDLVSFIRQLLPANRRTTLNVAFVNLLFAPIASLLIAIEATRTNLLLAVRSTGQVIVLEELLNQAVYGSGVGSIYLLDSTSGSVDFKVVIPPFLPTSVVNQVRALLDTHKQAGKRYQVVEQAVYDQGVVLPLSWEPGYPLLDANRIAYAVSRTGTYQVVLLIDGVEALNAALPFVAGLPIETLNTVGTSFNLTINNLNAQLTRNVAAGQVIRVGYQRNAQVLHILPHVDLGDVEVKLIGTNGTVYNDTYQTANVWGSNVSGLDYNRRRTYPSLPNGSYRASIRMVGQTAETTLDLNFVTANVSPLVQYEIPNQSGRVGQGFLFQIPSTTFVDPDGSIASIAVSGIPPGISYDSSLRTFLGTPTSIGTTTTTVTATDNNGATVQDQFTITIQAASAPDPGTPVVTGTSQIIVANSSILNPTVQSSGGKFRWGNSATYSIPGGMAGFYFVSGQRLTSAPPTTYDYDPGDEIIVYYVIATSSDVSTSNWNVKGWAKIIFGQA